MTIWTHFSSLCSDALGLGAEAHQLTIIQVVVRAIVVFFAALCIVRVADKRFFGQQTAFDIILAFILASMLARCINGSEPLIPTIVAGFALALLHRLLGTLGCRFSRFGALIKGSSQTLIRDGHVDEERLRRHRLSQNDLLEGLRLRGVENADQVKLARLERNGEISVVKKERSA